MNMSMYSMTVNDLSGFLNQGREILINLLESRELLTSESAKDFREEVAFVVIEKGMFGKIIDKVLNVEDKPIITLISLQLGGGDE